MSRADLETWCSHGMDVGSHTVAHRRLMDLSEAELNDDLRRSADALAEITGQAPRHFAVPWGVPGCDFDPEPTARLAKAAGYVSLFSTTRGFATAASDAWLMPRHVVEPEWPLHELDVLMGALPFNSFSARTRHSRSEEPCRSSS